MHPTYSQNMHIGFTLAAYYNPDRLDPTQTVPTKTPDEKRGTPKMLRGSKRLLMKKVEPQKMLRGSKRPPMKKEAP
jgi:hypothetical protein